MAFKQITTPRGTIIQGANGKAELKWDSAFAGKRNQNFTRIQKYVDSEVLRYCSSKVPFQTGMLEKSGKLGTVIGSGVVQYIAAYAKVQYYDTATTRAYDSNRGGKWFERMKVTNGKDIISGAKKMAKG